MENACGKFGHVQVDCDQAELARYAFDYKIIKMVKEGWRVEIKRSDAKTAAVANALTRGETFTPKMG